MRQGQTQTPERSQAQAPRRHIEQVVGPEGRRLLIYIVLSLACVSLEFAMGWLLFKLFPDHLVATNTVSILVCSSIHYALISKYAFAVKRDVRSAIIYISTFALSTVLQNVLIWLLNDIILVSLQEFVRYMISKALSHFIPFFFIYYLRKVLNERFVESI